MNNLTKIVKLVIEARPAVEKNYLEKVDKLWLKHVLRNMATDVFDKAPKQLNVSFGHKFSKRTDLGEQTFQRVFIDTKDKHFLTLDISNFEIEQESSKGVRLLTDVELMDFQTLVFGLMDNYEKDWKLYHTNKEKIDYLYLQDNNPEIAEEELEKHQARLDKIKTEGLYKRPKTKYTETMTIKMK